MKILQVHNKYQYSGGEDTVYSEEKKLLENKGHIVLRYERNNEEIAEYKFFQKAALFNTAYWNKLSYNEVKKIIKDSKPDICHVHNYLPLISPSVFYACREMNLPVVHTLHNYRLLCCNAYLFRDGNVCEECEGKSLYNSVKYGCYRNSRIETFVLARMIQKHKELKTWKKVVDAYICLTEFSKEKFVKCGLSENKTFVKPNFLNEVISPIDGNSDYFFFMGRIEEAKGINTLLVANENLDNIYLRIAGEGPLKEKLNDISNIDYLGKQTNENILNILSNSIALIFPSLWYEGMPMSIIEAFACKKPVIASNHGAMAEIIEDGKTGLLFEPGNALDLSKKIKWANEHREEMKIMGLNARKVFEEKYTAERNYEILMYIYNTVIERKRK